MKLARFCGAMRYQKSPSSESGAEAARVKRGSRHSASTAVAIALASVIAWGSAVAPAVADPADGTGTFYGPGSQVGIFGAGDFSEAIYICGEVTLVGDLYTFGRYLWISPNASFSGAGRIIVGDPAKNTQSGGTTSTPTYIDFNGNSTTVSLVVQNPAGVNLGDLREDPLLSASQETNLEGAESQCGSEPHANATILGALEFGIDAGHVRLGNNDLNLDPELITWGNQAPAPGDGPEPPPSAISPTSAHFVTNGTGSVHYLATSGMTVEFPIGIGDSSYTPVTAAVDANTKISARVSAYAADLVSSEEASRGVDRIWHLDAIASVSGDPVSVGVVSLTHEVNTQGAGFAGNAEAKIQTRGPAGWASPETTTLGASLDGRVTHSIPHLDASASGQVLSKFTPVGGPVVERLWGADRYATSVEVSKQFDSFAGAAGSFVYLATGENFPDALVAAPAAALRNAPLLLTRTASLPANVADEIRRLDPEKVIIAGGLGAVSAAVQASVAEIVGASNVIRLGGASRYETAELLVNDAFPSLTAAYVATGSNFPDALAASAAAAKRGIAVMVTPGSANALGGPALNVLGEESVTEVFIAGGPGVVSEAIRSQLASLKGEGQVTRFGGATRYETAVLINRGVPGGFGSTAYVATGASFPDALGGAALAGATGMAVYLSPTTCVTPDALADLLTYQRVRLLGGEGVLSARVFALEACVS